MTTGPKNQDLTHYRGDDFDSVVDLTDIETSSIAETWFTLRKRPPSASVTSDADAVFSLVMSASTSDQSIAFESATALSIHIAKFAAAFSKLSYSYDLQVRTTAGAIKTLTWGLIEFTGDITREV